MVSDSGTERSVCKQEPQTWNRHECWHPAPTAGTGPRGRKVRTEGAQCMGRRQGNDRFRLGCSVDKGLDRGRLATRKTWSRFPERIRGPGESRGQRKRRWTGVVSDATQGVGTVWVLAREHRWCLLAGITVKGWGRGASSRRATSPGEGIQRLSGHSRTHVNCRKGPPVDL